LMLSAGHVSPDEGIVARNSTNTSPLSSGSSFRRKLLERYPISDAPWLQQ